MSAEDLSIPVEQNIAVVEKTSKELITVGAQDSEVDICLVGYDLKFVMNNALETGESIELPCSDAVNLSESR